MSPARWSPRASRHIWLATWIGLGAIAAPATATATQPRAEQRHTTDGVDRLIHDYSGQGDASSIELNPALLVGVRGFDLTLLGYRTVSDFTRGSGFGGFVSLNLGLGIAAGFGAQFVSPGLGGGAFDYAQASNPRATKLSWALAGGMGEFGGFGVSIHGIRSEGTWIQRPDIDIGLMSRVFNYGSVGVVARLSPADLRSQDFPSEFSIVAEAAVRPLGTHNIEVAGGIKQSVLAADPGEDLRRVGLSGLLPRGRVTVRYQGLGLSAEVEQVQTTVLDPQSLVALRDEKAVRGSVSLQASWDFITASGGLHAGVSEGVDGYSIAVRFHSRRNGRVYWPRRVDAERLDMSAITDEASLIAMLQTIERARKEARRSVLVVDARDANMGWASAHELRSRLAAVRNAGGHVFAYVEDASMKDYYLASVAERIFIHPAGGLQTYGLSSTSFYARRALAKVGVKAEVVRIAEYKSAGEQYTNDGPSDPDRRQRQVLQADIYDQIVEDIAIARRLPPARVRDLFDDAPYAPDQSVEAQLADEVIYRDQLIDKISEDVGAAVQFRQLTPTRPQDPTWSTAPYIAVVLVEGSIVDGESRFIPFLNLKFAGGDTIAQTLRDVRNDPACKGVIVRVNSPGGSALASDIIWREVSRTAKAHRDDPLSSPPIVVSMSDVAASGGYYVATGASTVLADPNTITGSIGVLSIHFDLSGLLAKLGISAVTFKQGENPDINSIFKPYSESQRKRVEASIQRTYDLFRKRVADGRAMTPDQVHKLARGRVYSGEDAKQVGLVDHHGGLYQAIAIVRERGRVRGHRALELRVLPRQPTLLDLILKTVGSPFGRNAQLQQAADRARAKRNPLRNALPRALNKALARIPLSLLFLREGQAHALMPYTIHLGD